MILYIIAFFIMAWGLLDIFGITVKNKDDILQAYSDISRLLPRKKESLSEKVKHSKNPVQPRGMRKMILDAKSTLIEMNRSGHFPTICITSGFFAVIGVLVAGSLNNAFLVPVLAIGLAMLPFIFVLLSSFSYKKRLIVELGTSLSIVTAEYTRSGDIIQAVKENIEYFESPVKEVFERFVVQVTMVNPNVSLALRNMKKALNQEVFHEWIDAVILSEDDPSQRATLGPIIRKFSEIRIVDGEVNYNLYEPLRDHTIISPLLLIEPFLIWMMNPEWIEIAMGFVVGQIMYAGSLVIFFYTLFRVVQMTRPAEFRR
ncbi:type II secretion system F family protein [Faecalispora jeddahensis]|uniref:type II secretion system F family protein n=1 Tax=Faecalispora jeddahensis TaxID=1414721 RepID=UPI0028AAE5D6|nr:hypothetical protein [Faecalispora jeddahensis]